MATPPGAPAEPPGAPATPPGASAEPPGAPATPPGAPAEPKRAPGGLGALAGARVVLGVSGGIAAYKSVEVCRRLVAAGAHVAPVLTKGATRFVGTATFSALASEPALTSIFSDEQPDEQSDEQPGGPGRPRRRRVFGEDAPIVHTRLGRGADLVVVCPATARLIGSYAAGIPSDLLGATLVATSAPVLVCPAMHTEMWEHPSTQENISTLRRRGVHVLDPVSGALAGGDVGTGRLPEPDVVVMAAARVLEEQGSHRRRAERSDLRGLSVLVTAGGTREPIDPVRFISNRSSGKQGHAIAEAAAERGACVTLVSAAGFGVPARIELVEVETSAQMAEAVLSRAHDFDVIVMAAAVADFRPKQASTAKLHKIDGIPELVLEPTTDILAELGRLRASGSGGPAAGTVLVGFAAETEGVAERATAKLAAKGADIIVGNDVTATGAGFSHDTNQVTIVTASSRLDLP
ncbi:MAG: bifunctional phosphopantothenoylcysteine decarboxylase/phosphopantothenate--cysteine ligase CoaBC, partial [Acidimicrobiales bacterium]